MTLRMQIAKPGDGLLMAIRQSDKDEIAYMSGCKYPNDAVVRSIRESAAAVSVWSEGSVVGTFGLVLHPDRAVPWFICSDAVDDHPKFAMRGGKEFVKMCLDLAGTRPLCNHISPHHTSARKYVQALGFVIDPDHPASTERAHFFYHPHV